MTKKIILNSIKLDDKNIFLSMADVYFKDLDVNFKMNREFESSFLENIILDKDVFIDFVHLDNEKIGFVKYSLEKHFYKNTLSGKILDFWIEKKYRRLGYGLECIKILHSFFKKNKVSKVKIEIMKNNYHAKLFWNKIGYAVQSSSHEIKL